mgnify:CR=1 FL=1
MHIVCSSIFIHSKLQNTIYRQKKKESLQLNHINIFIKLTFLYVNFRLHPLQIILQHIKEPLKKHLQKMKSKLEGGTNLNNYKKNAQSINHFLIYFSISILAVNK